MVAIAFASGSSNRPLAHDLVRLGPRRRAPLIGDAADDVVQAVQGVSATLSTDLQITGFRGLALLIVLVGLHGPALTGRHRHQHQGAGHILRGQGQGLGERELGLEQPTGHGSLGVGCVGELAGVGDPLVDQNDGRAELREQLAHQVAGVGAGAVGVGDDRVPLRTAELPGQLAPQRVHHGAVRLAGRRRRRDLVAHECGLAHRAAQDVGVLAGQQVLHALRELVQRATREQVPHREHRVGLAATERGLQVDHRVGRLRARDPVHRAAQQLLETVGEIRATEELDRVLVFLGRVSLHCHRVEIRSELGIAVPTRSHVRMRLEHLAPRRQLGVRRAGQRSGCTHCLSSLLLEVAAEDVLPRCADGVGLADCADRAHDPLDGVQGADGVIGGEGLEVRDVVAYVAQLSDEALLSTGQVVVEDVAERADRLGDDAELVLRIGAGVLLAADALLGILGGQEHRPVLTRGHELRGDPLDVRVEHFRQRLQRAAHRLDVAGRHQSSPPKSKLPWTAAPSRTRPAASVRSDHEPPSRLNNRASSGRDFCVISYRRYASR